MPFSALEFPIAIRLLGARVDLLDLTGLLRRVLEATQSGDRMTIFYVNVHCLNVREQDAKYRSVLENADVVYCDGTGVRLGARLAGLPLPHRLTGADWVDDLADLAAHQGLSLYLLAGEPGVTAEAAMLLTSEHPALRIVGAEHGYSLSDRTLRDINAARPDILLVGMGSPTQEKWIAAHRDRLDVPVVWAVGALFDFVAGRIPRGPSWMTQHGLEWLCRLAAEPRKLWRRYLIGNPLFLIRVLRRHRLGGL